MNSVKGITKYYIGFAVLMFFGIGMLIYAFTQAGAAKTDRETNKTVEQITYKLEANIATTGRVPNSLQAAGISNPASTVTYQRLSNEKYKICIDYKAATSGFDAGWFSLLGGAFYGTDNFTNQSHNYFDSSVEYNHKKGQNCQTITSTSVYSNQYFGGSQGISGVYTNCDNYTNSYPGRRTAKIKSVDTANKTIYLDDTYAQNFEDSKGFESTTDLSSLTYSSATTFYDQSCKKITAADLTAGERADFYVTSISDGFAGQVEVVASGLNTITQ